MQFILPNNILDLAYDRIVKPIGELHEVGINLNPNWGVKSESSRASRSGYLLEILESWDRLQEDEIGLKTHIAHLQKMDGEYILDTGTAADLSRIRREIARTKDEMVDKPELFEQYRELVKSERRIKRKSSGLDRPLCERVFNGQKNGQPFYKALIRADIKRVEAMEILNTAVARIEDVAVKVEEGLEEIDRLADQELASREIKIDDNILCRIDGERRLVDSKIKETSGLLKEKKRTLQERIGELKLEKIAADEDLLSIFPKVCDKLRKENGEDLARLVEQQGFREDWENTLIEWADDLEDPETAINDRPHMNDIYINSCNVVGATCNENRRTIEDAGFTHFDLAIIDEVSKATPPELLMPMMLAKKAILIGDHRQLPPLWKEREGTWEDAVNEEDENRDVDDAIELNRENYERHRMMVTSSFFKELYENVHPSLKTTLWNQYRAGLQIMQTYNTFYGGKLRCGLKENGRKRRHNITLLGPDNRVYISPDQQAIWIDSSYDPMGRPHYETQAGTSKTNDLEAIMIAKVLADIDAECLKLGYTEENPKQVAVISFYGRQVRHIRNMIQRWQRMHKRGFEAIRYDVNTVDRFQGKESPIVLVSLVRNKRHMRKSAKAFIAQFQRINVAFSRAMQALIICGAIKMFYKYPVVIPKMDGPGSVVRQAYRFIIDEIQRNGRFFNSSRIIDQHQYRKMLTRINPGIRR